MTAFRFNVVAPLRVASGIALAVAVTACSGDGSGPNDNVIDRDTFIAVYVELRAAALSLPGQLIDLDSKQAVLAEHGLSDSDLLDFAERHGRDAHFMSAVWMEVEDQLRALADSDPNPTR